MKITTDVNSTGLRPAGNVLPRSSSVNRSSNVSDAQFSQDVIAKMQRDKSVIDALAIAQTSRELVQKALNVSARLLSLASEAMVTGRVNMDEVNTQMSSINGSMGNYGESVSVPVEGAPAPVDNVQLKLDQSFARIKEKAADMAAGKPVGKKDFEPVIFNLKEIGAEFEMKISRYSAELGSTKRIDDPGFNYPALTSSTAEMVSNNPVKALGAQANISYEMAGKLTNA